MKYKWNSPVEWLLDMRVEHEDDAAALRGVIYALVHGHGLDNDLIQDVFQDEMEEDGYFDGE